MDNRLISFDVAFSRDGSAKLDRLLDIAIETNTQFKRILESAEEEQSYAKRIRKPASASIRYTETCIHNYRNQDGDDDSESMPTPKDPPANVRPSDTTRKHVGVLSAIESDTKLTDMEYVRTFKKEGLQKHKQ